MSALSLEECRLFLAIVSCSSLRVAADRLGIPRATLSRQLRALEARLERDLFLRNGRSLAPTAFGRELARRAKAVVEAAEALEAAVEQPSPKRAVRISASPVFAQLVVPPLVRALNTAAPELSLEVQLTHSRAELFSDEVDLALRRGPLPDSTSLLATRLGTLTMTTVASAQSEWACAEDTEAAMTSASWIRVAPHGGPFRIVRAKAPRVRYVTVWAHHAVDSQGLALSLVRQGLGVARVNDFVARPLIKRGELVELFPSARDAAPVFAVRGASDYSDKDIRIVLDLLREVADRLAIWDEHAAEPSTCPELTDSFVAVDDYSAIVQINEGLQDKASVPSGLALP